MLKEYLSEAASLLAEAVLGRPVRVAASGHCHAGSACTVCGHGCGAGEKRKYFLICNDCPGNIRPCWRNVGCVLCDYC